MTPTLSTVLYHVFARLGAAAYLVGLVLVVVVLSRLIIKERLTNRNE